MNDIPDCFKPVGKVYVVNYDNGELWEDAFHCVEQVFNTREAAQNYLIDLGLIGDADSMEESETWREPKYVCSMNNMICDECPKFENQYEHCKEYEERIDSEWDNSYYTIEEYNLIDVVQILCV